MKLYTLGEGLKRARRQHDFFDEKGKKLKSTQKVLADTINVSLETIRNWEQNRAIPSLSILLELSDLYQCDLDYLTGRIDCKTHDLQFICDNIGLSESATTELIKRNAPSHTETYKLDILSTLICSGDFWKVLHGIDLLKSNNTQHRIALATGNEDRISETTQTEKVERFDTSETFNQMIKDISAEQGLIEFKKLFP